jgi:hypothetical protein
MNGTGRNAEKRSFTTGEKALAVMVAAGVFGYWAGLNLATPGDATALSTAAAAALPAAVQQASRTPAPQDSPATTAEWPLRDAGILRAITDRDDPPIPAF